MDINTLLLNNSFQVSELLRQHNIIAPDIQTGVKQAYARYGDDFMLKLVNKLSGSSDLSGFDPATDLGPPPPAGSYTDENGVTQVPAAENSGKFWEVWGNLLKFAGATGQTINQFKQDVTGTTTTTADYSAQQGSNMKYVYIAAAILIIVIVMVLIFKK